MSSVDFFDQRLTSLKQELNSYGQEIIEYIQSLYTINQSIDIEKKFDLKNDPFSILPILQIDLNDIIQEAQNRHEYKTMHSKEIEECINLSKLLQNISNLVDKITECEAMISKINLLPACQLIQQISDSIEELLPSTNSEIGSGKVCTILRKENKLLRSRLISKIKRIFNECIQFEYGRIIIYHELKGLLRSEDMILPEPIALKDIWLMIELAHQDHEIVEDLLKNIWIFILRPLWQEKKVQLPKINKIDESGIEFIIPSIVREGNNIVISANSNNTSNKYGLVNDNSILSNPYHNLGSCRMPIIQLLDYLNHIFSFLSNDLLCGNDVIPKVIAEQLNSPPISFIQVIIDTISSQLPKTENELNILRKSLEVPCRILETKLHTFGFLNYSSNDKKITNTTDGSENTTGPLTEYIKNLPSIYSDLRRKEILKLAREVVLSDYHNTMLAAGDANEDELSSAGDIGDARAVLDQSGSFAMQKLKFDSCQISLAACRLLKLIHDVMKQACSASATVAHILFQSARDCLELFMAIVPIEFSDVVDNITRMGAVFYNDCLYIAHNCTLITHKYRLEMGKIDEILQHTVGFADFIPRFRNLGDICMTKHLEEQRASLMMYIQRININPIGEDDENINPSVDGFRPGGLREGLFKGGLKLADKLGLKVNLNDDKYSFMQCNNYENALLIRKHMEHISSQWLTVLQDIVYSRLFGYLFDLILKEVMKPILSADCIAEEAGSEINRIFKALQQIKVLFPLENKDDDALQRVCSSWKKFLALTDILEYSLSEVTDWLPRKKFITFTGTEMTSLIKALFEDSPRRQTILASVLEMSS